MKNRDIHHIRGPILATFTGALLVLLIVFTVSVHDLQERHEGEAIAQTRRAVERFLAHFLASHGDEMLGHLRAIARDARLRESFLRRDRTALLADSREIHDQLRAQGITHLYFLDPERRTVLRVHQPTRFDDRIDRYTARMAELDGRPISGLELGPLGTLTLRTVLPWQEAGQRIGYLELGMEIHHLVTLIRQALNVEVHIFTDKRFLEKSAWQEGMAMLGRQGDWEQFADMVWVDSGNGGLSQTMRQYLQPGKTHLFHPDRSSSSHLWDHHNLHIPLPITVATGEQVAWLVVGKDDSRDDAARRTHLLTLLLASLLVAAFLGLFLFRLLRTMENRLAKAHGELRHSEKRARAILDTAMDAVISIDKESRILEFNKAAERIFGFPKEEVLGRDLTETIIPPELRERHQAGMAHYLATGEHRLINRMIEQTAMDARGNRLPVDLAITVVSDQEFTFFTAYLRDITERRQMLDSLQDSYINLEETNRKLTMEIAGHRDTLARLQVAVERAEAANLAKSQFLATMSHEIRTPMGAIIGMCDLLSENATLHQEERHYVRVMQQAGQVLLALINDILDLSKIEAGQLLLEQAQFDPALLVTGTVDMMRVRATDKGLAMTCQLAADLPGVCLGDAQRVQQVLLNLLGNAIKFTQQGGVTVRVQRDPQQALLIEVQDTGIGIDRDQQEIIFQPFMQAEMSTSRRFGGTGLGLTICRKLVSQMGGEITVASEPGRGSLFRVRLPLPLSSGMTDHLSVPVQPGATPQETARRVVSILLVDDADDNRLLVRAFLKRFPCRLVEAENGEECLARFQQDHFDLVLMDMQMPVMDGFEATRQIRAWEVARQRPPTPIIALTAHAMREDVAKTLAAGCNMHVTKPITKSHLLESINQWL
ncbi:MAG: ATP-binding protein [Magnetococcus sp. DMHC-8]